jgi:transcriptional regulator with XRE-family HTH domain
VPDGRAVERGLKLAALRQVREAKCMTQRELAARSSVNRATIMRLESGAERARFSTIKKLAEALGVEPLTLVGF